MKNKGGNLSEAGKKMFSIHDRMKAEHKILEIVKEFENEWGLTISEIKISMPNKSHHVSSEGIRTEIPVTSDRRIITFVVNEIKKQPPHF